MKRLTLFSIILTLILLTQIPLTLATVSVYMSNPVAGADGSTTGQWNAAVVNQSLGRAFSGNDQYLHSFTMYFLNDSLTETGTMRGIVISDVTGTVAAGTCQPVNDAEVYEWSTNVYSCSNIVGQTAITFYFSGSTYLNSANDFCIGVWMTVAGGTNFKWYYTTTGSSWYSSTPDSIYTYHSYSPCFILNTTDLEGEALGATATPAPLPTGGAYDTSDTDVVITALFGYLVPLLTFLLPALILGWVTHWEKWPIMIGLAIGAGLTYLFLGSAYVWLVFLVAVGLAGMVFSGRMRHDE